MSNDNIMLNNANMINSSALNFLMLWVQEKPETYPMHGCS